MAASQLLARSFALSWSGRLHIGHVRCALCGEETKQSVPLVDLLKPTASDLSLFRFQAGGRAYLCQDCAACYAEPRLLTGSLLVTSTAAYKPTVSLQPGRARWCDLLSRLEWNEPCVAVLTSNTKRRLWPYAVLSRFGHFWQPLYVHENVERVLTIDVQRLRDCVALVSEIYTAGFPKAAIATTLLHALTNVGQRYQMVLEWEAALRQWRDSDEFLVSLFVAQKPQEDQLLPAEAGS